MHALLNIALRAARDGASALTGQFDRIDRVKVLEERHGDALTTAHLEAEKAMLLQLQKTYPQHGYQSSASQLPEVADPGTVWTLDPLIGTENFLRGSQGFLLGLSCLVENQLKLAVFVDPLLNEEFTAFRGSGASLNGRRIRVSNEAGIKGSLAAVEFASKPPMESRALTLQQQLLDHGAGIRVSGNGTLDILNTAAARLNGGICPRPASSILPGISLLLREAGGLISDTSGNPGLEGDELIFGNPKYFKQLLQLAR